MTNLNNFRDFCIEGKEITPNGKSLNPSFYPHAISGHVVVLNRNRGKVGSIGIASALKQPNQQPRCLASGPKDSLRQLGARQNYREDTRCAEKREGREALGAPSLLTCRFRNLEKPLYTSERGGDRILVRNADLRGPSMQHNWIRKETAPRASILWLSLKYRYPL